MIGNLSVILATALSVAMLLPQLRRIRIVRHIDGVSVTWPVLGVAANGWYSAYLMWAELWVAAVGAVVITLLYLALAGLALRFAPDDRRGALLRGGTAVAVFCVVLGAFGWETLGVVLGLTYGVQLTPAIWTAWRSSTIGALSATTWIVGAVEAALWLVYGVYESDTGVVVYGVTGVVCSGLILARIAKLTASEPATPSP